MLLNSEREILSLSGDASKWLRDERLLCMYIKMHTHSLHQYSAGIYSEEPFRSMTASFDMHGCCMSMIKECCQVHGGVFEGWYG